MKSLDLIGHIVTWYGDRLAVVHVRCLDQAKYMKEKNAEFAKFISPLEEHDPDNTYTWLCFEIETGKNK